MIELSFNQNGSLQAIKGRTTKKDLKQQMNKLKKILDGGNMTSNNPLKKCASGWCNNQTEEKYCFKCDELITEAMQELRREREQDDR